jgi:RHS repeat-associated protein
MTIRKNLYYSLFLRKNLSALDEKNARRAELDEYYYGARYYNPKESVWLSTDPLSGYNPVMETEHYIDGQHNGGVYSSFNHNTYMYCLQNPIQYIDPNGKQESVTSGNSGFWDKANRIGVQLLEAGGQVVSRSPIGWLLKSQPLNGGEAKWVEEKTKRDLERQGVRLLTEGDSQSGTDKVEAKKNQPQKNSTRGSNNRKPADDAEGDHTVIDERGATTYKRNDNNPNKNSKGVGFSEKKKVDYKGGSHYNKKTDEHVPTLHVHEGGDVRPAVPGKDMPKKLNS